MKTMIIAAALLLGAAPLPAGRVHDLDAYRWRKRVVAVFASSADDPRLRRQRAIVETIIASGDDRDLMLVAVGGARAAPATLDAGALRRRYHAPVGVFRAMLIGKDGHVAIARSDVIAASELTGAIDAMPMRRDETRRRP